MSLLFEMAWFRARVSSLSCCIAGIGSGTIADVSGVQAAVHLMVSENDQQMMGGMVVDHVAQTRTIEAALGAAGKQVELTVYPPFEDDGHRLFFEVREPYWADAVAFFTERL